MAKIAQQNHQSSQGKLRETPSGRGVIGSIGKPPGFKVVRHEPDSAADPNQPMGIGACGTAMR
jgi:hypothetical protein